MRSSHVLTIHCPDVRGVVAAVTCYLAERHCSIVEAQQHQNGGRFFMRVEFTLDDDALLEARGLEQDFVPIVNKFVMNARFRDRAVKPRILVMVSKFGHCLVDLVRRWQSGQLDAEIVAVVSNHEAMRSFTEWAGIPFHLLPITEATKQAQERQLMALADSLSIDLVVLARYMQILSPELCRYLSGRCINIHHSFLPSFKGAKPYHQAHARGVKVIGATAHYVTTDLDEGPIIEQDTRRVNHARTADDLVIMGQEVECSVLARAVRWHLDDRVLMDVKRTVIFE